METVFLKFLYIGNNKADTMPETKLGKRRECGEGRPATVAVCPQRRPSVLEEEAEGWRN